MKTLLAWLFGTVTARITGAQPEDFLNLCARENLVLWRMVQRDLFTLEVQVTARQYARLCQLAQGAQCGVELEKRQGLPYFFLRFRRRYALLAGVALCLVLFAIGSRTVLTIDVTGNETVTREEIISQLRLCGVSVGTYGPGIPIREVENRMMMAMDALSYFSLNLHGTRAEVIVREGDPAPEIRAETVPTDVVSSATGVITHIEPWVGDAQFQEGEAVCEGDVLRPHGNGHRHPHRARSGDHAGPRGGEGFGPDLAHPHRPDLPEGPGKNLYRGGNPPLQPVPHGQAGEILSKQWNSL